MDSGARIQWRRLPRSVRQVAGRDRRVACATQRIGFRIVHEEFGAVRSCWRIWRTILRRASRASACVTL